ncbi:MAG: Choice-of-anchor protein, partial [Bacteroidota bacterium]|nr:Choice-of-anchor protein [Bacteroidota bacterium]
KVDSYQLDDRPIPTPFTAKWNANGLVLESLQRGSMNFADYSKSYDRDSDNNLYETGTFTGTKTFDKLSVKSAGGKDFYITKYGGTPGSEDLTDDVFYVYSPKLEFKINSADLGDCVLGQSSGKVFEGVLHNVGSLRVEIEDITKGGNNPGDFTINFPSRGVIIPPHDSINVEISFLPTETGFRSCDVTIKGICAQPVTLNVSGNGICSGEAIPLVDMGSQNLNIKKDSLVKVIFTNTNKQIIVLTPVIEGTHSSDFDWFDKDGNKQTTIPLEAGSSVDLIIRFNPTDVGLRTATLNYNLPPGCVNQKTDLNGYGIVADMSVTPVEWVDRRIVTVNDSIVIVKNNGAQFVRVLSVVLETPPAGDIDIISLPGFPKQINSGDTMQIPVRFTPADTITYSNYVLIKIDGMQGELRALLRGNGILPKIEAVWDCPEPVKPGKSSTAYLTVYNNSLNSPLFLYDVDFHSVTDEFDWKSGSAPKNVIIQKDTNEVFEVIYTPKGLGPRGVNIDIYHDAVKGDDPDLKDMIYVQAQCDGLGFTTTPSIDLGRLLICDENTKAIKVFNESWNTDLSITGYEFEGADSVAFSIDLPNELLIPGSESRTFSVKFNPSQFKTYKCKLHLFNSIDQDLSVELSGSGHLIYLSVPDKKLSVQPGAQVMLIVNADIIGLEHPIIDTVTVKIKFDDKMCGFVEGSLQSRLNGWTWSTPVLIQKNELLVAGKGGIQTPFSSDLFAVKFVVLLSDLKETALYLQPMIEDCQTPDTLATMIGVKDVCFVDGRLIKVNSINYTFGDARPNPAKDKLDIDLGIGLDAYTTLEIYNTMGERVKILIEKEMNAGSYNLTIPLDDIPSGVYNLRLISGPYTQTQKIIIAK